MKKDEENASGGRGCRSIHTSHPWRSSEVFEKSNAKLLYDMSSK